MLRQCTMGRKTAKSDGDYFVFGHRRLPKDTPTAWKSQVGNEVGPTVMSNFHSTHLDLEPSR